MPKRYFIIVQNIRGTLSGMITGLASAGYFSVGVIYISMGILTALVALGVRGQAPDLRETLYSLKDQPMGPFLLVALIIGACALILWRSLQAFADLQERGGKWRGLFFRGGYFFGAVVYGFVALIIARVLTGIPTPPGEQMAKETASYTMGYPLGWLVVLLVGIGIAVTGGYSFYRAIRGNFAGAFRCEEMTQAQISWCIRMGRAGFAARGVIYGVVAYFLINAGINANPQTVTGQAGALQAILLQPMGNGLLALMALGLFSFGVFSLATARYGQVKEEKVREVVNRTLAKVG